MLQSAEDDSGSEEVSRSIAPAQITVEAQPEVSATSTLNPVSRLRWRTVLAVPMAAFVVLAVHFFISKKEPSIETHSYTLLFGEFIGVSFVLLAVQPFWTGLRQWMRHMCPIFTGAILLLGTWDVVTSGLRLLPLPYFPGPAAVLQSLINDRVLLLDSTWHSFLLLLGGYTLGVIAGLISGICIGWSSPIRYWGMPVLKVVGPIPATAWIPLAMVISPSAAISAAPIRRR